jgi:hypothetical protein
MMARNTNVPFRGRMQKRKTELVSFGLEFAR